MKIELPNAAYVYKGEAAGFNKSGEPQTYYYILDGAGAEILKTALPTDKATDLLAGIMEQFGMETISAYGLQRLRERHQASSEYLNNKARGEAQ